ncbi:MAG: hypothetical protein KatS3mg110_4547 [Pirellulaceae bacterium]|nr:MAG: hypothetical protein KatS3mg110_4547 [Pirellulaceae bacterium]
MIFRTNYRSIEQVDYHSRKAREAPSCQPTAVTHRETVAQPSLPNAEEEFLHGEEWELWCELMEKLVQPVDAERLLQRLLAESCVERRGNRYDSQRAASRRNWFAACAAVTVALIATVAVVTSLVPGPNRDAISQMVRGSYPTDTRDYGRFAKSDAAGAQTSQVEEDLAVAGLPELAQSSYDGDHAVPAGQAVDAALTQVSVELAAVPYWNEAARHWPIAHQLELLQAELAQSTF